MINQARKILVVGPSWVGDMVMAQSLFIKLKEINPGNQIDVLAPAWSFPLLQRMPEVNQAIAMPLTHGQFALLTRREIGKTLRREHYDQSIVLPNSWKSALIPFFARIPLRTGYVGEMRWGLLNDARALDKQLLSMTVQRFVALSANTKVEATPRYPHPRLTVTTEEQLTVSEKFGLDREKPLLALCPGAEFGPAKQWPVRHYATVAQEKIAEGWLVALFGSAKDSEVTQQINQLAGHACLDYSGKTSLAEAVVLLSLATAVVSNDSGLMHIAAALNKKVIALYGSTDPTFTPPLNEAAEIIYHHLSCSPCFQRECPLGHTHCLTEILPEQVIAKISS